MKKTTLFFLIIMQSIMYAFSQEGEEGDGEEFVKSTEKNYPDNKNVLINFHYLPLHDGDENTKEFKIVWDSTAKAYILEINYNVYKDDTTERYSFTISDQFAKKMHKQMGSLFVNFKKTQHNDDYIWTELDGYKVTFRTVVEDELWYLQIRNPSGNAAKMHKLCYQILEDAYRNKDSEGKKLDEEKYIKILDGFNFERTKPNN